VVLACHLNPALSALRVKEGGYRLLYCAVGQ
jgi:hypothetical protein